MTSARLSLELSSRKILNDLILYRMFSVTSFFVSPILGKMISKMGRKNSILIGFVLIIVPTLGLAQLVYIEK